MHLKNILMYCYALITVIQEVKKRGDGIHSLFSQLWVKFVAELTFPEGGRGCCVRTREWTFTLNTSRMASGPAVSQGGEANGGGGVRGGKGHRRASGFQSQKSK